VQETPSEIVTGLGSDAGFQIDTFSQKISSGAGVANVVQGLYQGINGIFVNPGIIWPSLSLA